MPIDPSNEDTIAAIATPVGKAGIGIIRLSGSNAREIAEKIFTPKKKTEKLRSHQLYLGHLIDPSSNAIIDEVLLSYMKAPNSYTREDVIEINAHSGYLLLSRILSVIIKEGARLAEPGEFTFRAFMNGRIDLTQAEAIVDLINSKSSRGLQLASRQIDGAFRRQIESIRQDAIDILAQMEVAIDFPEDEIEICSRQDSINRMRMKLIAPIEKIIAAHDQRKIWFEGVDTIIVGRVNVGKSSLLNRLLNEEKAIVTPVPGTTRDLIESILHIEGVPLRLIDTAGFRKVRGEIERIGISLTKKKLADADLSLVVIDRSRPLNQDDMDIISRLKKENALIIINKIDLPPKVDEKSFKEILGGWKKVHVSALTGEGIEDLRKSILSMVLDEGEGDLLTRIVPNLRHKKALTETCRFFQEAVKHTSEGIPLEIIATDINEGLEALGEIIGRTAGEEVLDRIFSQFCIGK